MAIRRTGNPVSLFPFLAVLVCAMGALIFLLLVVTRQIRAEVRAEAIRESETRVTRVREHDLERQDLVAGDEHHDASEPLKPPATRPLPKPPPAVKLDPVSPVAIEWDAPVEQLARKHRTGRQDLEDVKKRVGRLEVRRTQAQEAITNATRRASEDQARARQQEQQQESLDETIAELKRKLLEARREFVARKTAATTTEQQFEFLPFDGETGTTKRPIFVECHRDRIEFASERINLTAADLAGYTRSANPLLAGLRALIKHWDEQAEGAAGAAGASDSTGQQPPTRPYVLMVVRPGGIHAYYIARKLLRDLDSPIGYELVPDEMPLRWPTRDETAAARCRAAIDRTIAMRPRSGPFDERWAASGTGHPPGRREKLKEGGRRMLGAGRPSSTGLRSHAPGPGPVGRSAEPGQRVGASERNQKTTRQIPNGQSVASLQAGRLESSEGGRADSGPGDSGSAGASPEQPDKSDDGGPPAAGQNRDGSSSHARQVPVPLTFEGLTRPESQRASRGGAGSSDGGAARGLPRHWGHSAPGATIGYERRVRVFVAGKTITVEDEPPIKIDGTSGQELSVSELRERVIAAVQRTVRGWGAPPERFYWVPAISFRVTPGGHLHYERLNSVFRSWDLSTRVEHVLPTRRVEAVRLMQGVLGDVEP